MRITLEPLSDVGHIEEATQIALISCLFREEFADDDFEWDSDLLVASLVSQALENGEQEEADYLESEPTRAAQTAKEQVIYAVRRELQGLSATFGEHFPFLYFETNGLMLRRKPLEEIDGAGSALLWLTLFYIVHNDNNYVQCTQDERRWFNQIFDDVFEIISGYAVAGRSESHVWHVGHARSVHGLLSFLTRLCHRLGSGRVKSYGDLQPHQQHVNDSGVDCISLSLQGGVMRHDAELLLVQATIQASNRVIKIMDSTKIQRFRSFFLNWPNVAARGGLAIPFEATEIDHANCAERDCVYITKHELMSDIARHPVQDQVRSGTRRLDARMKRFNDILRQNLTFVSVDGSLSI